MSTLRAVGGRLLRYFLAGLFAILPLVITVAIVIWVANFLKTALGPDTPVGKMIGQLGYTNEGGLLAYVLGWITVLGIVFLLGVVVEMGARNLWQRTLDGVLHRVPLIGSIYKTARQLIGMLDKGEKNEFQGMSVVYCVFGEQGGAGFLALLVSPDTYQIGGQEFQIVLIPTAPVPFGGGLLFVPKESIRPAEMSVDGLMSIYVSMGVTASQFMKKIERP